MQPLMLVNTSVLVTLSVQNIASEQGGRGHRRQRELEQPQQEVRGEQDRDGVEGDEPVPRRVDRQVAERRQQQRAAGRIQVVRVDVVEVLVVDVRARA